MNYELYFVTFSDLKGNGLKLFGIGSLFLWIGGSLLNLTRQRYIAFVKYHGSPTLQLIQD